MLPFAHGNFSGKHLVVFGCGYVGGEIARSGVARGMRVTALTRNEAKAILLRQEGVTTVVADLASPSWHGQISPDAEYVLNSVSSGGAGIDSYRRSYVEGMKSLLAWAAPGRGTGTIVYTSSTSVYPHSGGAVVDEQAATEGDERTELLLEAENTLRLFPAADRRWFILRLAGIYGPGRHHLLAQVRSGQIAGKGAHRLNLAHRDDIVAAVWACFAAPPAIANEVFNVADDGAAPKQEIVQWLAARTGAPAPNFTGEPAAGRRAITPDRVIANRKLKTMLGWEPRFPTFREGYESILSH